ncbi:MAG: acetyl-CoA carboxylase biotin carboxylase subunit family protein [Candidatus Aminicenantes bacterium]|nr:acetyl-CoA carboxylase biotin carboxylase subunit family protein [Candidatus Aminicenantes bacterium]
MTKIEQTTNKKKKVLIPNRGVIALDIIDSLKSIGLETILLYSPEDSLSLPVRLADRSYKFFSSKLEDSYLDMEAIIDKALELQVDYIHPGYGFLTEDPDFFKMCEKNGIEVIGPGSAVLRTVRDKIEMRKMAGELNITFIEHSPVIKSSSDFASIADNLNYPVIIKPLYGYGGKRIRAAEYKKDAAEQVQGLLKREDLQRQGIFVDAFFPYAHQVEIPFFRDGGGNILFLPEIESSIQRRFQKIFQESPSVNISSSIRESLYRNSRKLIEKINYIGLGYVEFIIENGTAYFSEINPSYQINSLIPEIHIISNFIKKQIAISTGGLLHNVRGIEIVEPKYNILLVSLMAEDPLNNFQPSSGTVSEFFYYSTIRNLFKTALYAGAKVSPLYDPYIGKIVTFSSQRETAVNDMRNFLENIIIKGIKTNLTFLKHLLRNKSLHRGDTIIDFLNLKREFSKRKKKEKEIAIATALFSADFHIENSKNDFKTRLAKIKQPGFFKKLFNRM